MTDQEPKRVSRNPAGRTKMNPADASLVSQYVNHGIRSPEARAAWASYMAERRAAKRTTPPA